MACQTHLIKVATVGYSVVPHAITVLLLIVLQLVHLPVLLQMIPFNRLHVTFILKTSQAFFQILVNIKIQQLVMVQNISLLDRQNMKHLLIFAHQTYALTLSNLVQGIDLLEYNQRFYSHHQFREMQPLIQMWILMLSYKSLQLVPGILLQTTG